MAQTAEYLPVFAQVKERLRDDIRRQDLGVGDHVPSIRKLAERYEVAYLTARRAVNELIGEGVLVREEGRNATVARIPADMSGLSEAVGKRGKTGTVVLFVKCNVLEQIGTFSNRLCIALEKELFNARWRPMLCLQRDLKDMPALLDANADPRTADGVIICDVYHEFLAEHVHRKGIKAVFMDYQPRTVPVDSVGTNNYLLAQQVMDYLWQRGHRRIDFFGHFHGDMGKDLDSEEQEFFWQRYLREHGGEGAAVYARDKDIAAAAARIARSAERPTALYVSSPGTAEALQKALKAEKLSVPGDLSIMTVTWDTNEPCSISSVHLDYREFARLAVDRVAQLVEQNAQPGARLTHTGTVVERGTVAAVKGK